MTDKWLYFLLGAVIILQIARMIQAHLHNTRLDRLLNDLATMIGELFDTLGKE